ncbi:MAG TPA: hypothetical protein VFX50_12655, partial [Gemmatimonadales bacterium]|nr:hypothetical protein [Gemmatimonadales bacterium]
MPSVLGLAPGITCADLRDEVYRTPVGLPAMTPGARGDVVRCADEGAGELLIAYRTERGDGRPAISTARVSLPAAAVQALPVPMVVVAHPTAGIADGCVPSRDAGATRNLAEPWLQRGLPVIAPDHAGLGNEGVHAYLDNRESGQQLLDAARALEKLLTPGG